MKAEDGSTVNITGGTFAGSFSQRAFEANVGSEVNVSGGEFNGRFGAFGTIANISGGNFGTLEAGGTGTVVNLLAPTSCSAESPLPDSSWTTNTRSPNAT